jgi:hypothetical protein
VLHVTPGVHVPQFSIPPQPSGAVPQFWPAGHDVFGMQGPTPHMFGWPGVPPPQISPAGQVPQTIGGQHAPMLGSNVPQL